MFFDQIPSPYTGAWHFCNQPYRMGTRHGRVGRLSCRPVGGNTVEEEVAEEPITGNDITPTGARKKYPRTDTE